MPIPYFQPVIGSSFDALAGQQAGWAGFNARVDEGNIARFNAAEAQRNNWLANVAAMREQAQREDAAAAERAQQTALTLGEARRRDAIYAATRGQELGVAEKQFKAQQDLARETLKSQQDFQRELADRQERLYGKQLEVDGNMLAANYGPARAASDAATARHRELLGQIDNLETENKNEGLKKKPNATLIQNNNNKLKTLQQQVRGFAADAQKASGALERLTQRAENAGFSINEDGTIAHPQASKTWSWKAALKEAKGVYIANPPPGIGLMPGQTPGQTWGESFGGGTATATEPTPVPAPPAPPPALAAPPPTTGTLPQPAPLDPRQRVAGQPYSTPKGVFTWTGTGWSR